MPTTKSHRLVLVTVPFLAVARRIVRKVLSSRTAACVNIVTGIESHYWWEGKLARNNEVLLQIKTSSSQLKRLRQVIKSLHPYELPEFISLPITEGSRKYLNWIDQNVGKPSSSK